MTTRTGMPVSIRNRVWWGLPLVLAVLLPAGEVSGQITLFDGAFANEDWETIIFYTDGNGGSVSAQQVPSGGNPGSYRSVSLTVNNDNPYSSIRVFHRFVPFVHDPSFEGAILSIDYSEDSKRFSSTGQHTGIAVRQGGRVYPCVPIDAIEPEWTNHSLTNLTAEDFSITFSPDEHPNFVSGGPIEIGFWRGNSGSTGYSTLCGIDNWSVTIHLMSVPTENASWGRIKAQY